MLKPLENHRKMVVWCDLMGTYPPVIKNGVLENGPFISDFPNKTSIQFGHFLASHVWLPEGIFKLEMLEDEATAPTYLKMHSEFHHSMGCQMVGIPLRCLTTCCRRWCSRWTSRSTQWALCWPFWIQSSSKSSHHFWCLFPLFPRSPPGLRR